MVLVWLVVVLSGHLSDAIAVLVLTEAGDVTEVPVLLPAPNASTHHMPIAPHSAGEEDRPENECDEDDDFHTPSNRRTSICTLAGSSGNISRVAFALRTGHTSLWPLPPDAN